MKPGSSLVSQKLSIILVLCFLVAIPAYSAETGVQGTALIGPVRPGPTKVGQNDEAPLSASFIVFAGKQQIAQFKSDKNGFFRIMLSAGEYTIVPDKSTPIPSPQSQRKKITVPEDGFAVVVLRFDSGMR